MRRRPFYPITPQGDSMRKSVLHTAVAAALAIPSLVGAQTPAPSPLTGNLTIASDYRFRGISQTYRGPAIQGGIDYAHSSGIYLGNWNSNVSSLMFAGGSAVEMDFYTGWKKSFGDFGLDVGTIYYYYPNAEFNVNTGSSGGSSKFDNWEVYIGGSWKWLSAKIYYALDNYFGLDNVQGGDGFISNRVTGQPIGARGDSDGTTYTDFSASYPVSDKFSIVGHYGILKVKNYGDLDYNDWKIGATYDLRGWVLGAAYVDTDAKKEFYFLDGAKGIREIGKSTVVLSVSKTF
jgi:uncharacterized protein (TIGR02001 family)